MSAQFNSDAELRRKLKALGVDVGPINDSTRFLYQRQLLKRQNEERASAVGSAAKRPRLAVADEGGPSGVPNVNQLASSVPRKKRIPDGANRRYPPTRPVQRVNVCPPLPRDNALQLQSVSPSPPSSPPFPPSPPSPPSSPPSLSSHFNPRRLDFSQSGLAKSKSRQDGSPSPTPSLNSSTSPSGSGGGFIQLMTSYIGAGVKKLVNHIQEAASPRPALRGGGSPSFRYKWEMARERASPSSHSPLASPKQMRGHDSVSVDEIDLPEEEEEGASALYVPQSPVQKQKSNQASSSSKHSPSSQLNYDWELLPSDVDICKRLDGSLWRLGKGGFGEVFKGLKDGVDEVAVKVIRIQSTHSAVEQFKQEIDMISKLRHRHILQFYGACIKPNCLYMVTELMQTDLFSALRHSGRYQWTGVYGRDVMIGLASGLHYLHSRRPPVVHRDIKSPNVLLMDGIAKIADIGIARTKAASDMTAQRGFTIAWAAPEVVYRKRATEKIDIWSLGIILWEVVTGNMPRPGQLVLPSWSPSPLQSLYSRCTDEDSTNRPTAAEVMQELKHAE